MTVSTSSILATPESAVMHSPFAEFVNTPKINLERQLKTVYARVLTSSEYIKAFEEKEEQKRVAEEDKQRKKAERELKKGKRKRKCNARRRQKLKRQQ